MSVSIPKNFQEKLLAGLDAGAGRSVDRDAVSALASAFLGEDEEAKPLDADEVESDKFNVWRKVLDLLVASELERADRLATVLDQQKPVVKLLRALICLPTDKFKARSWLLQALQEEPVLIFSLANMAGTHLKSAKHEEPVSKSKATSGLVEAALLQSGIDPARYFAKPERVTSIAEAMAIKGNGYIPFARSKDPYVLSIAHLPRPDLKGEAYQIVAASGIKLHPEFTPYLDRASKHDPQTGEAVCLIDGTRRKMLAQYLKMKWGIDADVYLAFFGLHQSDLMAIGFNPGPRAW
jgi:hypothetical protein